MAPSSIAKRNAPKSAPKIAPVGSPSCWYKIVFGSDGGSNLSSLLEVGATLPMVRYDAARLGHVLNLDSGGKADLLLQLESLTSGLNNAIAQIGMLMSGQDEKTGYINHRRVVDIGFTIDGLAHLAEQLLRVREQVEDAEPVGADAAELERTVSHD